MARNFPVPPVVFNVSTPTYRSRAIPWTGATQQPPAPMILHDEPPLLEELGIDTCLVWRKTLSILLHPLRPADTSLHIDADQSDSAPFLFILCFGLFQLLTGKFHFVLVSVAIASLFFHHVFSKLSGGRGGGQLDLYRCASLVGYGMLPMVIFSAVALFLPRGGGLSFGVAMSFVFWSTRVCTGLLASSSADEQRGLIACACFLVYMLFSLLVIS